MYIRLQLSHSCVFKVFFVARIARHIHLKKPQQPEIQEHRSVTLQQFFSAASSVATDFTRTRLGIKKDMQNFVCATSTGC